MNWDAFVVLSGRERANVAAGRRHMTFSTARLLTLALLAGTSAANAADIAGTRAAINHGLDAQYPHIEALYKDIHSHPELGFQETRTAALLAGEMRKLGYDVTAHVGKIAIVAIL